MKRDPSPVLLNQLWLKGSFVDCKKISTLAILAARRYLVVQIWRWNVVDRSKILYKDLDWSKHSLFGILVLSTFLDLIMKVHLYGAYSCTKAAWPYMRKFLFFSY